MVGFSKSINQLATGVKCFSKKMPKDTKKSSDQTGGGKMVMKRRPHVEIKKLKKKSKKRKMDH